MSFLAAPLWIQVALAAEGAAIAWLTWRFGVRGLGSGLVASLAFWFALGLFASYLIGRLEGGRAAELSGILSGAVLGAGRVALAAMPLIAAGALFGGVGRAFLKPKHGPG